MDSSDRLDRDLQNLYSAFFEAEFSSDLKLVIVWLILAAVSIYMPFINTSPLRVIAALPVVLFIPGYALIAALFPDKDDIDLLERIALSFGLSIAVVPLIGLGLNYTPWGIRLDPIVTSLVIFTIAMVIIAQYRRGILSKEQRFRFPFREIIDGIHTEFFPVASSKTDRILSIILLISIIAAIGTTIFVIVVPKEGEKFTEFYILGEKQKAADYPERITLGEEYPMYIGIGNHEYRNVSYTVETHGMMMDFDESTNISTISRIDLIDTFKEEIQDNETVVRPYNLTVRDGKYNRIEFLLFNETIPDNTITGMDRINQSYRDLHLWVKMV
jgi:uncharacterized membrane protein